jgi:hypothetical protein
MSLLRITEELGLDRSLWLRGALARTMSAGVVAGVVGGLTMALALFALFQFVLGKSPFLSFTLVGATVLADARGAAAPEPLTGLVGFVAHFAIPSVGWGVVYGILDVLTRPQRASTLLFMGLAVGALAQVIDVMVLLPPLAAARVVGDAWIRNVPALISWLAHLAYGVGLSFYPWKYDPASGRFV